MNPEDPIKHLESYYEDLRTIYTPYRTVSISLRWWEVAGGLAAGAAMVVAAVTVCLSSPPRVAPLEGMLQHQARMAGIAADAQGPHKHAQRGASWHI